MECTITHTQHVRKVQSYLASVASWPASCHCADVSMRLCLSSDLTQNSWAQVQQSSSLHTSSAMSQGFLCSRQSSPLKSGQKDYQYQRLLCSTADLLECVVSSSGTFHLSNALVVAHRVLPQVSQDAPQYQHRDYHSQNHHDG